MAHCDIISSMDKPKLKSAWKLAKEIAPGLDLKTNSVKNRILRMAERGEIKAYTYVKNGESIDIFDEEEVVVNLGNTKRYEIRVADSFQDKKSKKWYPRLDLIRNPNAGYGEKMYVNTIPWNHKLFDTKKEAEDYASTSAKMWMEQNKSGLVEILEKNRRERGDLVKPIKVTKRKR